MDLLLINWIIQLKATAYEKLCNIVAKKRRSFALKGNMS
jgi:hypothetical protein